MLTKLVVRNFKRFDDVEIPLGSPVVFIGPNNSGKTTALQALALWELGLRRWKEKRSERATPEKRPGVAINRLDLLSVPMPSANLLWRGLRTRNIRIDVLVEGNTTGVDWRCGLEFDFANAESFFCRPLRLTAGRTAEVLRNLCYSLATSEENASRWDAVVQQTRDLFQVDLEQPEYVPERGEIQMGYRDHSGVRLDLSSSGRGLQQTLLLLAYLALHPGSVLLLDEPDAHLELLRQREIFQILSESARSNGSQLIIASHSEEILNQAAETGEDSVVAFLGKPHRIPRSRTAAVQRALKEVRFDQYYLAEQKGWVLYLENRTDLNILRAFAKRLNHSAGKALEFPFLYSIGNQPNNGRRHFDALSEAKPDLEGYLLVDHDAPELRTREHLLERKWERREIENYICQPETLESFAKEYADRALQSMTKAIEDRVPPAALRDRSDPWWDNVKASDEFLDLVFPGFFQGLGLKPDFPKASYHELVRHIPPKMISPEVVAVLDEIDAVARKAHPAEEEEWTESLA